MQRLLCIFLACALLLACDKRFDLKEGETSAKSIDTYLSRENLKNVPYLKIKNSALDKDFFLYGHVISMLDSPTGYSLKGRIIRFRLVTDRVVMLESPHGLSIGADDESIILLAEFPIVEKDDNGIIIDFARGMTNAFTMRNIHTKTMPEPSSSTADHFTAIGLLASFVKSIEHHNDIITISQIAQWKNQKSEITSAELRYNFKEYLPSKTYEKSSFDKNRWYRYFSTPPMIIPPSTKKIAYVTKWNLEKPIVFYISSNTPSSYRDAIKEGLLYWNHIIGREVIVVKDLSPGLSAPHPHYNIVQWISWDDEASAYADMIADPFTGEILQAQIYIRSGWAIQSAKKIRNRLDEFKVQEPNQENNAQYNMAIPTLFEWPFFCQKELYSFDALANSEWLVNQDLSDRELTKIINDILRAVVAHEMGHVFGLKHNLAANLGSNVTYDEHEKMLKNYLEKGELQDPNKYLTTSVMDVFSAADDALVGAHIKLLLATNNIEQSKVSNFYAYDKMVIDAGYFRKPATSRIPFCTDEDIATYLDCQRWDMGNDPLLFAVMRLKNILTPISVQLVETFMLALDKNRPGGPLDVPDIVLTDTNALKIIEQYIKEIFAWFNDASRSIKIESFHEVFGPHNKTEITDARFSYVRDVIEKHGVSESLFAHLPPFKRKEQDALLLANQFIDRLSSRLSQSGWSYNSEILTDAHRIALQFFTKLNDNIIQLYLTQIIASKFLDPKFQLPIEEALGAIAREIILATDAKHVNGLPIFTFDIKQRALAASILSPNLGFLFDWSVDNLEGIMRDLKSLIEKSGMTPDNTKNSNLSREQREWLMKQTHVGTILMNMQSQTRTLP